MRYFGPFLLLLLMIALFFRVEFFFTVLYFLAAILILARLWMRQVVRQLHSERHFTDRAFTNDRVRVRLVFRNAGWLPILWLEVDETLPLGLRAAPFERQVIALGPHAHAEMAYTLNCYRRGRYQLGPTMVRTGDPLGIGRHELRWAEPRNLIVYPQVVTLAQLGLPTRSPLATLPVNTPLFEDTSRVASIRSYQRGDPLRRVHWPATARTGQLVVKQYQPAIARETLICLDLHEVDYVTRLPFDAIELAIVVAASLANHTIVHEKLPVGLLTSAAQAKERQQPTNTTQLASTIHLPPRKERGQLIAILEHLAEVEMATEAPEPFTNLLRRDRLGLAWGGTIVIITGRGSTALTEALLALRRSGLAVAVIFAGVTRPTDGNEPWAAPPGVTTYTIHTIRDLERL